MEEQKATVAEELRNDIRFINRFLYSIQKHRIAMGNWIDAKERAEVPVSKRIYSLAEDMAVQEKKAKRMALGIVKQSPVWEEYFLNIRGIGESLATSLMAEIGDISRFPTPSSLWAYAGLTSEYVLAECENGHKMVMASDKHKTCPIFNSEENEEGEREKCGGEVGIVERVKGVAPKRKKGHHYLFNSKLKTTAWKIAGQLLKQGDDYFRDIYYTEKEKQLNRGDVKLGHAHNRALRKMSKRILSTLWEAWRLSEGLEVRVPYVVEKLGHTGYIAWPDLKRRLQEERLPKAS